MGFLKYVLCLYLCYMYVFGCYVILCCVDEYFWLCVGCVFLILFVSIFCSCFVNSYVYRLC
jgi:hypothetical protein